MSRNDITGDEIKSKILSAQGRKNHDRIFVKKSATEWAAEDDIIILDPDGFDRTDPECLSKPISWSEFQKAIIHCTTIYKK